MKKLALLVLLALPLAAQTPPYSQKLLNAVTTTGTGSVKDNTTSVLQYFYLVVHVTGAPTGCTIALQTSTDNSTYANATATTTTGFAANPFTCTGTNTDAIIGVYCPSDTKDCAYLRANLSALSGGTSPTVTATLVGFAAPATPVQIIGTIAVTLSGTWSVSGPTGTYAASQVAKASAGTLYGFIVYNSAATAQFYSVFNATSLPANGATMGTAPLRCPATTTCSYTIGLIGQSFSTGITIGNSTTSPTLTTGAADSSFVVFYQ